ncbi:MAG: alpha-galactosidase [Caldilineales bacterium]|nr:alpha-galactosidase [Caldilineales bacterium]MCW5858763.1 alpha-galactosidase [Caldilineales bacterium]
MSDITSDADFAVARAWLNRAFCAGSEADLSCLPISFRYGDRDSTAVFQAARARLEAIRVTDAGEVRTILVEDPETGLECRCQITEYTSFPAAEWVVRLKNNGRVDSPILSDIRPLDTLLPLDADAPAQVHHARGSLSQTNDFEPLETPLTFRQGGSKLELSAHTGKPSTLHLPFFNLQLGSGGVIAAIGWTGGWAASFERQRAGVLVRSGMERTHLTLHPGEEIRTPRILLLFWEGDRTRSHNMLRRLILAHHTPRRHGEVVQLPLVEGTWGARTEASQLAKIAWVKENSLPAEWFLVEAAWHGDWPIEDAADPLTAGWMPRVGSWAPNRRAYPNGLRPVSEAAAKAGMGFVVWTEPERVHEGTEIAIGHPEWLLGPSPSGYLASDNYLLNLGNPETRRFITDRMSDLIREAGLTCLRQDFNDLRAPEIFAMTDAPDRVGMAEIRHVEGLYAFWDELLERHPGLVIDSVAGGGQRLDLEAISRTIVLWRSDLECWPFDPMAMQTQTQGLAPWIPLTVAPCVTPSTYAFRSALSAGLITNWSSQALEAGPHFVASQPALLVALPIDTIRALMAEASAMRKYFYGDFYPLLSFSLAPDAWAAWQFDRPDLAEGMVVAFRRHESPFPRWEARLKGLAPEASYQLVSLDDGSIRHMSGEALMYGGFIVTINEKPGSALFTYRRTTE